MQLDLRQKLLDTEALATLASGGITWGQALQLPAGPYVTLRVTSAAYGFSHDGLSGLNTARVQIDCFAGTYADANALRTLVIETLCGFQGVQGATDFRAIVPNQGRDFDPVDDTFRCLADLSVTWRAS